MQSLIDSVNNEFNLEKNLLVGIFFRTHNQLKPSITGSITGSAKLTFLLHLVFPDSFLYKIRAKN